MGEQSLLLRSALMACIMLLSAGCSSTGQLGNTLASWEGSDLDDVTMAWGQPDSCETIDGRRICSWYDQTPGVMANARPSCVRSFEIDADGDVIGWRWRGDYCSATADQVMARARFERPDALAVESTEEVGVAAIEPVAQPAPDQNQ